MSLALGAAVSVSTDSGASAMPRRPQETPAPAPRIARFERMGYGLFLHWGLYSQMAAGEWAQNARKIPTANYTELMKTFTAKRFSGKAIAKFAKRAGIRYVTLTSRHHEGFSLYDTKGLSKLDVMHTPAKRDLIRDFLEGCRSEGIVPMLYCTTLDWNEPRFEKNFDAYLDYLHASIELLCTGYGPIGGFWFDGNWSKKDADWKEDRLYGIIRKHQPEALIINNTGIGAEGALGNPEIDSVTFERGRPKPLNRKGHKKYVTGEMCHTLNFHWGRADKDFNYLSPAHVIEELCACRRAGANLLMNIGPLASGELPAYETACLERVGEWIRMSGSVIYDGLPCGVEGEGKDFGLRLGDSLYLFVHDLTAVANTMAHGPKVKGPGKRSFTGVERAFSKAEWLDNMEMLRIEYDSANRKLSLDATGYPYGTNMVVRIARLS